LSRVLGNGHALVLRGARHSNVPGLPAQSGTLGRMQCDFTQFGVSVWDGSAYSELPLSRLLLDISRWTSASSR